MYISPHAREIVYDTAMTHPFSTLFEKALKKSTPEDNLVLEEAEALRKKGYSVHEIYEVLQKLERALVQDKDSALVGEAVEEFSKYIEE